MRNRLLSGSVLLAIAVAVVPGWVAAQDPSGFPLRSICEVRTDANGDCRQDAVGDSVCVEGVVVAWKQFGTRGPGAIYDPVSGCCISIFDITSAPDLAPGTMVRVCGWNGPFNGLDEIVDDPADGTPDPVVTVLSTGNPYPCTPVTCADLADNSTTAEGLESCLIQLCGTFQATGTFGSGVNYTFQDSGGQTCTVRIDNDTDIVGSAIPAGQVTVKAILGQFDAGTACAGYQALPRSLADIAPADCATVGVAPATWSAVKTLYGNE